METRIQKWGNSLAVRIPKALAAQLGLDEHSTVEMLLEEERLVVVRTSPRSPVLSELLSQVTEENLHTEIDSGGAVGGEAW